MFIRLRTTGENYAKVRIGDTVTLVELPGGVPLSTVEGPVTVVNLRNVSGGGMVTVQYQEVGGSERVVDVLPSAVRASAGQFDIGDQVEVVAAAPTVHVPVGTPGVVVGGGKEYVSATFTVGDTPVTLTQDNVPCAVLRLVGAAPEDDGLVAEDDDEEEEDDSVLGILWQLDPVVHTQLLQLLSVEELTRLARVLETNPQVDLDNWRKLLALATNPEAEAEAEAEPKPTIAGRLQVTLLDETVPPAVAN